MSRTSKAWEALQSRLSQTVETVTRASRVDIVGGGVDEIDPPEDIDEFAEQAKTNAIARANMRKFVHDVWEPGYRVEGPDETVQYFEGEQEDLDGSPPEMTPEGGFLNQASVFAGERHQNFYSFGKECTWQRWVRGTVLVEYLKQDPQDPESQISGFSFIRPETVYPQVENNTNILLEPDFEDLPEDISRKDVDFTKRDEVAAYIQFDDESILGLRRNGFDEQDIPLSQNDVLKQTLEPDIGGDIQQGEGVFGTSALEAVTEDISEYEQTKRDRFEASRRKAYGIWTAQFPPEVIEAGNITEIIEWDDDDIGDTEAELNNMGPGDVLTSDAPIELERHSGEVPELDDMLMHYVKDISSALPTPLPMAIDFAGDINRDVTSDQREGYNQTVSEARQYQETSWTQALRFIAERAGLPTEGLEFKIQPEKQDNPVKSLETEEIDRMNTYIQTLSAAAGPTVGPTALVDRADILDVLDFPESEATAQDMADEMAEMGDEAAKQAWNDIMGVEALDFKPELHPRDDEGKFTESPISSSLNAIQKFADIEEIQERDSGQFAGSTEIQFMVGDESDDRNLGALALDSETGNYQPGGIVRYGEVDIPDNLSKKIANEDLTQIGQMIDKPQNVEMDMGDFTSAAPHVRVTGPVDEDELNQFLDDLTTAVNEWFYPYDADVAPQESEELQEALIQYNPAVEFEALQEFSEGDEVDTPDGLGVVADIITESFTTQDDEDIEASDDSPAYAVLVSDEDKQIGFYKASDLSDGTIETDVENPTEEIEAMCDIHNAIDGKAEALRFEWPESWQESSTPARVIALKAFAGMGGSFDGCEDEMRGNISRPEAFCGDFIDRLVGHGYWRGDSWAPGN